ncbi:hypothetical protein [Nonomuraea sp. NPDC050643]|uniref:hypothetical protein n=1 Tax=Nonomuraea sp. NPDC050643 TaxID=3155660 RepID=UPI0033F83150
MNIADLARIRDEDLAAEPVGQASGAGARALMESIMGEEREPGRGRLPVRPGRGLRRGLGLGVVAAGLAAALVVWTPFGGPVTEYANAAVSLKAGEGYIEVEINDPEAEAERFTEAFRAVGLDAVVKKAPVAPQDVGKLISPVTEGEFPAGTGLVFDTVTEGCASAWCGTVSVPVGLTGKVVFGIGRPAAPGEPYADPVAKNVDPDGGVIPGYKVRGRTVAEVTAAMKGAGMRITYEVMWRDGDTGGMSYDVDAEHVKGDWTVFVVSRTASDAVTLLIKAPDGVPKGSLPMLTRSPGPEWWRD